MVSNYRFLNPESQISTTRLQKRHTKRRFGLHSYNTTVTYNTDNITRITRQIHINSDTLTNRYIVTFFKRQLLATPLYWGLSRHLNMEASSASVLKYSQHGNQKFE